MKYKVGDRVRIKSIDWYNNNSNNRGDIYFSDTPYFISQMKYYCGKVLTIAEINNNVYRMKEDDSLFAWVDAMIEGVMEEEKNLSIETVVDTVKESNNRYRIVIDSRFDIEVDKGEYYAVRRKKYPNTYGECCKVLNYCFNSTTTKTMHREELIRKFQILLFYKDAYWKIAGEEMGLGKPWEPDYTDPDQDRYAIVNFMGNIEKVKWDYGYSITFVFPTEEMRDAFKENFDPDIEFCKELL